MDEEDQKDLFNEKYRKALGLNYDQWLEQAPKNESEAYARCIEIDRQLNQTYDEWFEAEGDRKEELQDYRDKLKAEYDYIEEIFHLEPNDRNW